MNKKILVMMVIFITVGIIYGQQKGNKVAVKNTHVSQLQQATEQIVEVSTYTVEYEVYEPTVVIRGKWGTGPGEFGHAGGPMQAEYYGVALHPQSLAVNSKGEIYILDHINNRIQKFSSGGKYLLSIPVDSCVDKDGKSVVKVTRFYDEKTGKEGERFDVEKFPYVVGINIVIDREDNLYYYCIKDRWVIDDKTGERKLNPNAKGEVWLFKEDKFVKKWEVGKGKNIELDSAECNPFLNLYGERFYFLTGVKKKKYSCTIPEGKFEIGKEWELEIKKVYPQKVNLQFLNVKTTFQFSLDIGYTNQMWISDIIRTTNRGEFLVWAGEYGEIGEFFIISDKGKLKSRIKLPFIPISSGIDREGNLFSFRTNSDGMEVLKWKRRKK